MTALVTCCVGDSITHGRGDGEALGWCGRLARIEADCGHDPGLYNIGIRADTGVEIATRWRAECTARMPDGVMGVLLFAFGLNETAEEAGAGIRVPLEAAVATARGIFAEAVDWKPSMWIGPTPIDETKMPITAFTGAVYDYTNSRIGDYNAAYAALAAEIGVPYLDLFAELVDEGAWRAAIASGDGIHPTAPAYAMMAERIAAWPAWRALLD